MVIWNSTFLFFKILIVNQDMCDFQYFYVSMLHFYFCTYLAFYSAHALFKTMQLFSTSLAIKFDPYEIETFCFLLLKAEIRAILAQKL
jgi:hypothetical protein